MKITQNFIDFRNKLADLCWYPNSASAIDGDRLTNEQREKIYKKLSDCIKYIDKELDKQRKADAKAERERKKTEREAKKLAKQKNK